MKARRKIYEEPYVMDTPLLRVEEQFAITAESDGAPLSEAREKLR